MSDVIKLKKGLDIRLQGKAETVYAQIPLPELFAIKPSDFKGLTPKMEAKVGDKVQAGSVLFYAITGRVALIGPTIVSGRCFMPK